MLDKLKMKTIKIELLEGTPGGFRRAEFTTQMMRVLVVPRDKQDLLEHCPEAKFQAVYLIVGEDKQGDPVVYVGKTRRMALRIKEHNKSGQHDFWRNVLYFVTKDNSLSSTEIEYLEWFLIRKAVEAGNYRVDNANKGCKEEPQVEPAKQADFADYYNQIVALSEVLGYGDIFNRISIENSSPEMLFFYKSERGADAKLSVREDGYYVLAGSICPASLTETGKNSSFIVNKRETLLKTGVLNPQGKTLVFKQDYKFISPSGAAALVLGTNTNGWRTWKDTAGKTLDERIRKNEG